VSLLATAFYVAADLFQHRYFRDNLPTLPWTMAAKFQLLTKDTFTISKYPD
jgi:hypothetical protein